MLLFVMEWSDHLQKRSGFGPNLHGVHSTLINAQKGIFLITGVSPLSPKMRSLRMYHNCFCWRCLRFTVSTSRLAARYSQVVGSSLGLDLVLMLTILYDIILCGHYFNVNLLSACIVLFVGVLTRKSVDTIAINRVVTD